MKDLKVPFSTFDIFSNIIPSIIFFLGILLLKNYSPSIGGLITKIEAIIIGLDANIKPGFSYTFIALSSIAIIFSTGHALMAAGSLLLDRLLIGKGFGYPYLILFDIKKQISTWRELSSRYYLTIVTLIIIYAPLLLWFPRNQILTISTIHLSSVIVFKIMLGSIRNISKKINAAGDVGGSIFISPRPFNKLYPALRYSEKKAAFGEHLFRWFLRIFFVGYLMEAIMKLIMSLFRMDKFNSEFIANFKTIFSRKFNLDIDGITNIDSSVFWLPYADIHENHPISSQTLQFIRTLYYFSRNLCMSLFILFAVCITFQFVDGYNYKLATMGTLYLLSGIIFFVHYYNIYFTFYSKQTFRIFYAHNIGLINAIPESTQKQCPLIDFMGGNAKQ